MARCAAPLCLLLVVGLPGCFSATETALLPFSPFPGGSAVASHTPQEMPVAPATTEAGINVARVGQKVLNANPGTGLQIQFCTLGGTSAPYELFHRGESQVYITETLARQCKTEGELAALLSVEVGKIVNERAATAIVSLPDRGPPPAVDIGNDHGGNFGPADGTRMMELAKYERRRNQARERLAPPAPEILARSYVQAAGYNPTDVDAVASLLRVADGNSKLEKLVSVSPPK
jgi:hypothetical protein